MEFRLTSLLVLVFAFRAFSQCGYTISETTTPVACSGACSGGYTLAITGIVAASSYTYSWSNGANTASVSNLCVGNYSVIVTDTNGCSTTHILEKLTSPEPIHANITKFDKVCGIGGGISANPSGGVPPYNYFFTGFTGSINSAEFLDLPAGIYDLTVTDNSFCSVDTTIDVLELTCLEPVAAEAFSPNGDGINESWRVTNLNLFHNYRIFIYDRWGQKVFDSNVDNMPWKGEGVSGKLPASTYYYIIQLNQTDKRSSVIKGSVSIAR